MSNGHAKERVGIVGVGRMGLAMLKHLVRHGYAVIACDIDDQQLAKARDAGAAAVKTPAEVARAADFVIIGVGYDDEVNQVVLGPDGCSPRWRAKRAASAATPKCARIARRKTRVNALMILALSRARRRAPASRADRSSRCPRPRSRTP